MRAGPAILVTWAYPGAIVLAVVLSLGSPPAAMAAQAPQTAEQWNTRGVQLRKKQRPEQALEAFERAHELAPSAKSRGQLGFVQHDLGHYVVAEKYLVEALSEDRDPWVVKNRQYLVEALDQSRAHIGYLVIAGPAGAEVRIQGAPAGSLPWAQPAPLAEGQAWLSVSAPGHLTWEKMVTIKARQTEKVEADLVPDRRDLPGLAPATPILKPETIPRHQSQGSPSLVGQPAGAPSADSWGARRIGGVALLAASVAGVAAGVTFLVVDGKPACSSPPPGFQCDRIRDTKLLGWSFVAGGAASALGGVLLYRSSGRNVSLGLSPTTIFATGRF